MYGILWKRAISQAGRVPKTTVKRTEPSEWEPRDTPSPQDVSPCLMSVVCVSYVTQGIATWFLILVGFPSRNESKSKRCGAKFALTFSNSHRTSFPWYFPNGDNSTESEIRYFCLNSSHR